MIIGKAGILNLVSGLVRRAYLPKMRALTLFARRAAVSTPAAMARRQWRPFSASSCVGAAQGGSMSPLDGIRILDMTRVLAGVCSPFISNTHAVRWVER